MVAADFQAPVWRLEQTMRAFLCVLTLFLIAGCSGGGGGNIAGPGDPPITPDPTPPVAKFWTVTGTADFGPTVTRPGVILATQSQEGILEPVVYGEKMATLSGDGAVRVSAPFSLKVPQSTVAGDYHLASYSDANADGKYDQTELVGDWSVMLRTDSKVLCVVDAFGDIVTEGGDATKYAVSIAAQYRR